MEAILFAVLAAKESESAIAIRTEGPGVAFYRGNMPDKPGPSGEDITPPELDISVLPSSPSLPRSGSPLAVGKPAIATAKLLNFAAICSELRRNFSGTSSLATAFPVRTPSAAAL